MFIYSLPLFFTSINLASPIELLIIFTVLLGLLFLTFPDYENNVNSKLLDNFLFSAWCGHAPLLWAFWPFFVILNACLYSADILAKSALITVSSWDEIHFVLILPICWWITAVWRCSKNTQTRIWGACARLMIFAVFFEYALKLLIRIDYPRLFFACEEVLLDYSSCF
jgi:hypothetical protein